jgi:hypothetical protein
MRFPEASSSTPHPFWLPTPKASRDYAAQVVGAPEMAEGGGDQKASGSTPPVFISYASQDAAAASAPQSVVAGAR